MVGFNFIFKLFLFGVLLHIIDDFVFQPICLSKLKQKKWWVDTCNEIGVNIENYRFDYRCALLIHSISWTIMMMAPIIIFLDIACGSLIFYILYNVYVHYITDDAKANDMKINH